LIGSSSNVGRMFKLLVQHIAYLLKLYLRYAAFWKKFTTNVVLRPA